MKRIAMFTDLHELTQTATLMIVVTSEGDQLRVSVTPTQAGDKTKPHALKPLSLLGTPTELDEYFGAALLAWQTPKKSLVEQAQDAANAEDSDDEDAKKAPSAAKSKPAPKAEKGKPGPKKKGPVQTALAADDTSTPEGTAGKSDTTEGETEFALEPAPAGEPDATTTTEPASPPAAPAPAPVVDTKTLNLF